MRRRPERDRLRDQLLLERMAQQVDRLRPVNAALAQPDLSAEDRERLELERACIITDSLRLIKRRSRAPSARDHLAMLNQIARDVELSKSENGEVW